VLLAHGLLLHGLVVVPPATWNRPHMLPWLGVAPVLHEAPVLLLHSQPGLLLHSLVVVSRVVMAASVVMEDSISCIKLKALCRNSGG